MASVTRPVRLIGQLLLAGYRSYRRSIRTRVVVAIVVLGAIVAGGAGLLVLQQITDGLVEDRTEVAIAEAANETAIVRERLGSAGTGDFDAGQQLRDAAQSLVDRGEIRGFSVVIVGPISEPSEAGLGVRTSPGISPASVPDSLQRTLTRSARIAWTYTRLRALDDSSRDGTPAVAVGTRFVLPADGQPYAAFYLFSLDSEQQTLNLVRRSLVTGGVLLVVLAAGVVFLVTRQVIVPVRIARRVAERIASGRLEERMHVDGEDDIARLASSFNQMADALQRQIRQLGELSEAQRQFVSDVSHELRTPLTTVRMAGDVLFDSRAGFEPVPSRAAELLQKELDRFETLLADLLEISRFDAGAARLETSEINLVDVAHRVVEQCDAVARRRGVEVRLEVPTPVPAEVDERRIERILRNLVSNAIDHANPRGDARVVVRVDRNNAAAAVTVRDFGEGLRPGQAAMVFNRFWRADPARARTTGGTGLGLAIALEDAQLHGGALEAWGAPGQGAQFRLTVPVVAGADYLESPLPLVPDDLHRAEESR